MQQLSDLSYLPSISSMLFIPCQVPANDTIAVPEFCTQAMRGYLDQVVAFMLRYYYIEDDNSTDFGDTWKALRVMGQDTHLQRLVAPMLKKIEGFDYDSVKYACEAMNTLLASRFTNAEMSILAYHTLTNAFQSIAYLSNNQPIYGFVECECGQTLGIAPMLYATRSFFTNGTLVHVVCAKKGLSHIDTRILMMHYALATESRLTHAGTEQFTDKIGTHYITHLAIVLATGKTIWKLKVGDIPPHFLGECKAMLLKQYKAKLKGRL